MKTLVIAAKDMLRSFRSAFLLVFMFVIPLFVTGMFYVMFGGMSQGKDEASPLPATKLIVANLDAGSDSLAQGMAAAGWTGQPVSSLGELIVQALESPDLAGTLEIEHAADAASAYAAVDSQQAGLALIIPPDFSSQFINPDGETSILLYQDPTLSVGPQVVKAVMSQIINSFSSYKIALKLMVEQAQAAGLSDPAQAGPLYLQAVQVFGSASQDSTATLLEVLPAEKNQVAGQEQSMLTRTIGPVMGGMMIFFTFFTAFASAETILKEEEEGTLPRLFTTPTPVAAILNGKFLAVGLTVLVQMIVLLTASHFLFGIAWGSFTSVALTTLGTVCAATGFGIGFNSLLKNTRQGSTITGGLLTMTGMLGMLPAFISTIPGVPSTLGWVSRLVPQGWAEYGLLLGIRSGSLSDVALNLLGLLAWALASMALGVWRFQKRYS